MAYLTVSQWLFISGLGAFWLGWQIVWAGRPPRALRRGEQPRAEPGTPEAFGLFWLDQYGYIGLTLAVGGIVLVVGSLA